MSTIPKHERAPRKGKKQPQPPQPTQQQPTRVIATGPDSPHGAKSMQHEINHVAGMDGIEVSLDHLVSAVARLTQDDYSVGLALCQNQYGSPVKLALSDSEGNDIADRLVSAVERIADAVAKLAGLNRPRLESWYEQCEYEPRYKDIACDGGAPGPKSDAARPTAKAEV